MQLTYDQNNPVLPHFHFTVEDSNSIRTNKIDAAEWFATNPDGCWLDYEFSFQDEQWNQIENAYDHLLHQSYYTPNKLWVKTSKFRENEDPTVFHMTVEACS